MKMSQSLEDAFNTQISEEFYASFNYLQMAVYCEDKHLSGLANWLRRQSAEEHTHAMKFFDHMLVRGNKVSLQSIPKPKDEYSSILEVFEQALSQEKRVTELIRNLYELATENNDFNSYTLLQWFFDEQVEEEQNVEQIVAHLKMAGNNSAALIMLDHEIGNREQNAE